MNERKEAALVSQPYGAAEERRREVIRRVMHTGAPQHLAPVSVGELQAWTSGTMADLGPRDFQDALTISRVFISSVSDYSGKGFDRPYSPPMTVHEEAAFLKAQERV